MDRENRFLCYMKPYIQPFERVLAERELRAVAGAAPEALPDSTGSGIAYRVTTPKSCTVLLERLTYWERVQPEDQIFFGEPTRQVRREATLGLANNGITPQQLRDLLPFGGTVPIPKRRVLRYGPHGIHEYRGKFFPQLVRSLLNIADLGQRATVLDPMCGSGTTLVEACLSGYRAIGLDLNPLSLLISRAKCDILKTRPDDLVREYQSLSADVSSAKKRPERTASWLERLDDTDRSYLRAWFDPKVLSALDLIASRVDKTSHPACRALFRVALSNILRRVSWQKDDDLRVRRETWANFDLDVPTVFLAELKRSVNAVLALLYDSEDHAVGDAAVLEADARDASAVIAGARGSIDAIITSPPYATALPYLDTDRLSLSYLGLLPRREHRKRDYEMIGNREITNARRLDYLRAYRLSRHQLPAAVNDVIDRVSCLNRDAHVGFRRRNLPAVLGRYFLDMRRVLMAFGVLLRRGAPAYVVVGRNHTIAGGQRVEIRTDDLLAQLGESVGLKFEEALPMETLVSRDIFKKNASGAETILVFRRV